MRIALSIEDHLNYLGMRLGSHVCVENPKGGVSGGTETSTSSSSEPSPWPNSNPEESVFDDPMFEGADAVYDLDSEGRPVPRE